MPVLAVLIAELKADEELVNSELELHKMDEKQCQHVHVRNLNAQLKVTYIIYHDIYNSTNLFQTHRKMPLHAHTTHTHNNGGIIPA